MWIELTKYEEMSIGYQDFIKGVPVDIPDDRAKSLIESGNFTKSTAPKKAEKADKTEKEK